MAPPSVDQRLRIYTTDNKFLWNCIDPREISSAEWDFAYYTAVGKGFTYGVVKLLQGHPTHEVTSSFILKHLCVIMDKIA
jgi:hypothetical protein